MAEAKAEAQESSSQAAYRRLAKQWQRNDFACWRLQAAFLRNTSQFL